MIGIEDQENGIGQLQDRIDSKPQVCLFILYKSDTCKQKNNVFSSKASGIEFLTSERLIAGFCNGYNKATMGDDCQEDEPEEDISSLDDRSGIVSLLTCTYKPHA